MTGGLSNRTTVTGLDFSGGSTTEPFAVAATAVAVGDDAGAGVLEGFAFALEGAGGTSAFAAGEAVGDGVDVLLFAWA